MKQKKRIQPQRKRISSAKNANKNQKKISKWLIWGIVLASSNYNCSSAASTTINGQPWHLCDFGSERVVKPGTDDNNLRNVAAGSVDVLAILKWLESTGHLPASSVWTAGSFGFEVTNTSGTSQNFAVNGFTWTS